MYTGIDLGQRRIHVVALDADFGLSKALVMEVADLDGLPLVLSGCRVVAIDAPEALSIESHANDEDLSSKFRVARCAEIALGRERGIWVPWVTPSNVEACPAWMRVGFRVFDLARRGCGRVVEFLPYAGFRVLAETKVPSKSTAGGLLARVQLLNAAGIRTEGLEMWSHDSLDACLAVLIAKQVNEGVAEVVTCGHDGSALWLPQATHG